MIDPLPKTPPNRLESEDYLAVRNEVLRRDGWKCQLCGSMCNLEVHHKQFRSRSGEDSPDNLITFCVTCHTRMHRS
jgi:5-methylcytosine-specific restriction endonuclease McrA